MLGRNMTWLGAHCWAPPKKEKREHTDYRSTVQSTSGLKTAEIERQYSGASGKRVSRYGQWAHQNHWRHKSKESGCTSRKEALDLCKTCTRLLASGLWRAAAMVTMMMHHTSVERHDGGAQQGELDSIPAKHIAWLASAPSEQAERRADADACTFLARVRRQVAVHDV